MIPLMARWSKPVLRQAGMSKCLYRHEAIHKKHTDRGIDEVAQFEVQIDVS